MQTGGPDIPNSMPTSERLNSSYEIVEDENTRKLFDDLLSQEIATSQQFATRCQATEDCLCSESERKNSSCQRKEDGRRKLL
jgi:hypothetical protein